MRKHLKSLRDKHKAEYDDNRNRWRVDMGELSPRQAAQFGAEETKIHDAAVRAHEKRKRKDAAAKVSKRATE